MTKTHFTLTRPTDVRNAWGIWIAVAAGICILSLVTGFTRSVTGAYAAGAERWLDSSDLYREGIHGFLYLPQAALIYLPFDQLPAWLGGTLWRVGSMGLFAWGIFRIARCAGRHSGMELFPLMTLLAILPSLAAFRNGQMTVPMTGCLLLGAACITEHRWWWSVFWLCLAVALKPLALVLMLLVLVLYPALWWRLPLGVALLLALPYCFQSPGFVTETYGNFARKITVASTPGFDTSYSDLFGTIRVFDVDAHESFKTTVRILAAFGTLIISWLALHRFGRTNGTVCVVLLALLYILLFNPRTENNTYVAIAPVIATLAAGSFLVVRWRMAGWLLTCVMALTAANFELTRHITPERETWMCPLLAFLVAIWFVMLIVLRMCPWIPEDAMHPSAAQSSPPKSNRKPG